MKTKHTNPKSPAATYLRKHKLHKTFWGKRIIAAERRGEFNKKDKSLACEWTTCACGFQSKFIPRDDEGLPKDNKLFRHGITFACFVSSSRFVNASITLVAIEKRAAEILKGMR